MLAIRDGEMIGPEKKDRQRYERPGHDRQQRKGMAMSERLSDINSMFNAPRIAFGGIILGSELLMPEITE